DLGFAFPYYGHEYEQIGFHSNGFASFVPARDIVFYWPQWERLPNANPGQADRTPPPTCMAVNYQDLNPAVQGEIYYWHNDHMAIVTWYDIPHFSDQQNQGPRWTFQLILTSDGLIKYQYHTIGRYDNETMMIGLQNEDRDLGFTVAYHEFDYLEEGRVIQFGPEGSWVNWVTVEPRAGVIEAQRETELLVSFVTDGIEEGYYWADLTLNFTDYPDWRLTIPLVMSLGVPDGNIVGRVTDARDNSPLEGAVVTVNPLDLKVLTDENGSYVVSNMPPRAYTLWCEWDDYLPERGEVEVIEDEDQEMNFSLRHATCIISPEVINAEVQPDGESQVRLTITNLGNADLRYQAIKRLPPEVERESWDLREGHTATQVLRDERIQGVVFAGDRYFLAGANVTPDGDGENVIWVLNRNFEPVDTIVQPGGARYGMRDLAWDGRLIWGSGERTVFGISPEGNVETRFEGPASPIQAITYDSDREILWLAVLTGNIFAYDRQGNALGPVLNRRGLRLYSLDYFPEDPDGRKLYILHSSASGSALVYKMDTDRGDTMRVTNLTLPDGNVEGSVITGDYDIYSWVMMIVVDRGRQAGGDVLNIYHLNSRRDWFNVEPSEGIVEAEADSQLIVTFSGRGLPEAELEGRLEFIHNGLGRRTIVPIHLSVIQGPIHTQRTFTFQSGWNMISFNIDPDTPEIPQLFSPLVDGGFLTIIKDFQGRFFYPARGFNNLPAWEVSQGYLMKVNHLCELLVEGTTVRPDEPIPLREGWNLVSYYPRQQADPRIALSSISDHLIIVKDGLGRFWLPRWGFINLPFMREGQGYQLKVDQEVELIYEWRGAMGEGDYIASIINPTYYSAHPPTGINMSLLILAPDWEGAEIGVWSSDKLCGSGIIQYGKAGISVWGDDPTTIEQDGAIDGEPLYVTIWDKQREIPVQLEILSGDLKFKADEITVAKVITEHYPQEFSLTLFPNPFNDRAYLQIFLLEGVEIKLNLFDIQGRQVWSQEARWFEKGSHIWTLSGKELPAGVYWLTVKTGTHYRTIKMGVVK
ncbi:MAG: carboxypeptidase regulatory-like domain-containing protein, partial [bacterium]